MDSRFVWEEYSWDELRDGLQFYIHRIYFFRKMAQVMYRFPVGPGGSRSHRLIKKTVMQRIV